MKHSPLRGRARCRNRYPSTLGRARHDRDQLRSLGGGRAACQQALNSRPLHSSPVTLPHFLRLIQKVSCQSLRWYSAVYRPSSAAEGSMVCVDDSCWAVEACHKAEPGETQRRTVMIVMVSRVRMRMPRGLSCGEDGLSCLRDACVSPYHRTARPSQSHRPGYRPSPKEGLHTRKSCEDADSIFHIP